jgi:hypothetical protein
MLVKLAMAAPTSESRLKYVINDQLETFLFAAYIIVIKTAKAFIRCKFFSMYSQLLNNLKAEKL